MKLSQENRDLIHREGAGLIVASMIGGGETIGADYLNRLIDAARASGGWVVVTDGEHRGYIGKLSSNRPGFQTVGVDMGCLHVRLNPDQVRPLRDGDMIVKP